MKKFFLNSVFFILFLSFHSFAQTVIITTGHEKAKATINFTALANAYLQNPPALIQQQPMNDEEEEQMPAHPFPGAAFIHGLNNVSNGPLGPNGPTVPVPNLPPSPPPVDSFEAVLDPGNMIPPDTHGAVDSNYCVTAINPNVRIQSRTGSIVSTVSLNSFWNSVNSSGGTFDPRVHYDQYAKRWIMVAVAGAHSSSSSILIGASQTSNPNGNWYLFSVDADSSNANWLDYPNVGFNGKWIVVTGNYFTIPGNTFSAGKMYIFNKANILSGTSANFTTYSNSSDFTFCPAITYDTTLSNLFVMEAWNGSQGLLKLLKISGPVNSPTISTVGYPSSSDYWLSDGNANNFAPQAGTSNLVSANDDRITQLIYMNHTLWCAHTAFLPYSSTNSATRCSIKWWQVDTNANPIQIGLIDDTSNTNFYTFPSLAVNKYNDAVIGFSVLSANIYPSAGYAIRANTDPADSLRSVHIFRAGQNTYYKTFGGSRNRWGDYSGTVLDPVNQADFWTIQEASASTADTWDTWWAQINTCNLYASVITASGPTTFCNGGSVTLYGDTTSGYSFQWQNGNTNIPSATTFSYNATTSGNYTLVISKDNCVITSAVTTVTLNAAPVIGPINGGNAVCVNSSNLTLSDTTSGGTWSTDNPNIATISTSGVVTGVSLGSVTIVYTVSNSLGCTDSVLKTITVGTQPYVAPITGPTNICIPATVTLTDTSSNGTWSSDNTGVATVNSSGLVSPVAAGSANISYTINNAGCIGSAVHQVVVNTVPILSAITGPSSLCKAASINLNNTTSGGTWTSSNTSVATVSGSGYVTGLSAGTVIISYSYSNSAGCADTVTKSLTVNPLPIVGAIVGPSSMCASATPITLFDTSVTGAWSSSNTTVATVSSSGQVTGLSGGTTHIRYTVTNGFSCTDSAVKTITINTVPATGTFIGPSVVCVNATINLSNTVTGGAWHVLNPHASITPLGVVSGITSGTDTVLYVLTNTCGSDTVSDIITINPQPIAGTISGPDSLCVGNSINLSHSGSTGTWSAKNSNASVNTLGAVTGVAAGADTIVYSVTNSCGTAKATYPIIIYSTHYCDSVNIVPALINLSPQVRVYPNPNDGAFILDISSALQETVNINITNIVGQSVAVYTTATNKILEIKLDQPNGIYILTASTATGRSTTKLTISR